MSLDLNKLETELDKALSNETTESLNKFLNDKRMTNNKQQTAVEWYIIKRDEIEMKIRLMQISPSEYEQELIKAEQQAKEMEKEKHEKFNKFLNDEKKLGISDSKTIERIQWYYNTYFNETYGGDQQ
jgi:uncharacterized protein YcgI (DUF1989 family)